MSKPNSEPTQSKQSPTDFLISRLAPMLEKMGYELVHLEVQTNRLKVLRLFIDKLNQDTGPIGVQDCVNVTKALDEPLDQMPEAEAIFRGAYELEVSSPGIDRPLRQAKDYEKFSGQEARIQVFRPLTPEELGNEGYAQKNPRQKNFLGVLQGLRDGKVLLAVPDQEAEVCIPMGLISKANLEPKFDLVEGRQSRPTQFEEDKRSKK